MSENESLHSEATPTKKSHTMLWVGLAMLAGLLALIALNMN
jgi:hypothetical protein